MKNELVSDIERVSMGRRRRKKAYLSAIIILLINYLKNVETTVINMMSALHSGNCYFIDGVLSMTIITRQTGLNGTDESCLVFRGCL